MNKTIKAAAAAVAFLPLGVAAQDYPEAAPCGEKRVSEDTRLTIQAYGAVATSISFPAGVREVINSAPQLWDVSTPQSRRDYILARPLKTMSERDVVGVTVVTEDDSHYNFLLQASPKVPETTCWRVVDERMGAGLASREQVILQRLADVERKERMVALADADRDARIRAARAEASASIAEIKRQAIKQAEEAVAAFRYSLNTNYETTYSSASPVIRLSDAYDDGRFTYLRLADDTYGVPSVVAVEDGRALLLQTRYDATLGEVMIEGLHGQLELRHGAEKIVVRRLGARTDG